MPDMKLVYIVNNVGNGNKVNVTIFSVECFELCYRLEFLGFK